MTNGRCACERMRTVSRTFSGSAKHRAGSGQVAGNLQVAKYRNHVTSRYPTFGLLSNVIKSIYSGIMSEGVLCYIAEEILSSDLEAKFGLT